MVMCLLLSEVKLISGKVGSPTTTEVKAVFCINSLRFILFYYLLILMIFNYNSIVQNSWNGVVFGKVINNQVSEFIIHIIRTYCFFEEYHIIASSHQKVRSSNKIGFCHVQRLSLNKDIFV